MDLGYLIYIFILPLAAFTFTGLWGRKLSPSVSGWVCTLSILSGTVLSLYGCMEYFFPAPAGTYPVHIPVRYAWLSITPSLSVEMGILADELSLMMMAAITVVSLMVHIFSLRYMRGEARYSTYFSFLSLFTFSMLGLVASVNLLQMYFFWELVGVSSYLLIGFYLERPAAVAAAKKAFIVTRFADLGFLAGILLLSSHAGTLDFGLLTERLSVPGSPYLASAAGIQFLGISALSWSLVLVFTGGAGKSAMFPLHVWLPDAMEGPTPVSALIHAATMVVAGVYLVARLFPVYAQAPAVLDIVAWTGAFSALFAAVIACTQNDIKRVLAYSTISQIGYMMLGLGTARMDAQGAAGYTASLFHLFTHASFKALLFLSAGVIIHAVHTNDIRQMGGLRRLMPLTHILFLLACLSIAGVPPFAGFFSKESVLEAVKAHDTTLYIMALGTAGLTAFYMFRLYWTVFFHKSSPEGQLHSHESSPAWSVPLLILGSGAVLLGLVPFDRFVTALHMPVQFHQAGLNGMILPVFISGGGILIAWLFYSRQNERADKAVRALNGLYRLAYNRFHIDTFYLFAARKVFLDGLARLSAWADRTVVDGMINMTAKASLLVSHAIRGMQSGKMQEYGVYFLIGVIGLTLLVLFKIG